MEEGPSVLARVLLLQPPYYGILGPVSTDTGYTRDSICVRLSVGVLYPLVCHESVANTDLPVGLYHAPFVLGYPDLCLQMPSPILGHTKIVYGISLQVGTEPLCSSSSVRAAMPSGSKVVKYRVCRASMFGNESMVLDRDPLFGYGPPVGGRSFEVCPGCAQINELRSTVAQINGC